MTDYQSAEAKIDGLINQIRIEQDRTERFQAKADALAAELAESRSDNLAYVTRTEARIAALEAALTPSAETKAIYHGEFHFDITCKDELGGEYLRNCMVPWTTVKEIMAAILAYSSAETFDEHGGPK
jgi:hypothetical protein